MSELKQMLVEDVRKRGGDPFSMAYELTKIYAATEEAEADKIPRLFLDLYAMFLTGELSKVSSGKKAQDCAAETNNGDKKDHKKVKENKIRLAGDEESKEAGPEGD